MTSSVLERTEHSAECIDDDGCCPATAGQPSDAYDATATFQLHPTYGHGPDDVRTVQVRYRWLGKVDGPVVIVQGGTSASRRVAALPGETGRGWWEACIGPHQTIDTTKYRVLGVDWVTPAELPDTVAISTYDQVQAIAAILRKQGVNRALAHIGASYGGMIGLALAASHPELVERLVVISAAHRAHPMSTALRVVQRRIVELASCGGDVDGNARPQLGQDTLALARALAVTTYRSDDEFAVRFAAEPTEHNGRMRFPVEDYLDAVGERFVAAVQPERFCALSTSIDLHRIDPQRISVPTTLIGVGSDRLVPIADMRELADRIPAPCTLYQLDGHYGHDTFLKEATKVSAIARDAISEGIQ